MAKSESHPSKIAEYATVFIALVVLAIVLKTFQSVLRPFALATLLAFLVTPLARLSKEKNIPVWLTFSGLFLSLFLVLGTASSFVSLENLNLQDYLPQLEQRVYQESSTILPLAANYGFDINSITPEQLTKHAMAFVKTGLNTGQAIFSESMLALILLMFILQSMPGLFALVERHYGPNEVENFKKTLQQIEGDILAYLGTKSAMSFGTALGTGLILFLFKAQFIFVSLFLIFILNFIPVIGSLVAVVLVLLLFLFTAGPSITMFWLFLALMVVQILFGSILEPKITGNRLNMSPILIIFSLYLWGWIWGIIGMLISVPLTLLIMVSVKHLRSLAYDSSPSTTTEG